MICHCKEIIHRLLSLWRRDIRREIQIVHWKIYLVLYLVVLISCGQFKSLEANNQDGGKFPYIDFLNGWLMLFALFTIPFILPVKILSLAVLSQTLLQ
jgi:hypothetical protein